MHLDKVVRSLLHHFNNFKTLNFGARLSKMLRKILLKRVPKFKKGENQKSVPQRLPHLYVLHASFEFFEKY